MMQKIVLVALTLCIIVLSIAGCKDDYSIIKATTEDNPEYAAGFKIEEIGNNCQKVIDAEGQSFVLVPEGKKVPADYANLPSVSTPVKDVVILSVTFGALMRPLGVIDSIVGSGTLENELYIDEMKQGYASGRIKYVGGGGMGAPDFEMIKALNLDVVFCSTYYADSVKYYEQLKELGVTVVACNDFLETDPLARFEWIKFIAAFYDKEETAETYFNNIEKKIDDIKAKTKLSSRLASVLWTSIWSGTCYVSGGESYTAKMVEMAGGEYLFKDLSGSVGTAISLEELYSRGQNCNVFIYASTPPYINSIKEIVEGGPVLADLPVIKAGEVYCFQPWYFQIADKPDELVQDLAYIFYPNLFPGYQLKNFMKLPAN